MNGGFYAVFGGFCGAALVSALRTLAEYRSNRSQLLREYRCATKTVTSDSPLVEGEFRCLCGRYVPTVDGFDVGHPVWQFDRKLYPIEASGNASPIPSRGDAVFYGPYTNDFPEPGTYRATFRILGLGFTSPEDILNDYVILKLDVNKTVDIIDKTGHERPQALVQQCYVRVSDLSRKGWQSYALNFYSDAQGEWEYRAYAYYGSPSRCPDNPCKCGSDVRIYFDSVSLSRGRMKTRWY